VLSEKKPANNNKSPLKKGGYDRADSIPSPGFANDSMKNLKVRDRMEPPPPPKKR
jgi:hypothetical protein